MFCHQCGSSVQDDAAFCPMCGASLAGAPAAQADAREPRAVPQQPGGFVQPGADGGVRPANQTNGVGTAGFVIALIDLFVCWIPVLGWTLWLVGLVLSLIGLGRQPRGLAIAGTVLSLLGFILIVGVAACVGVVGVVSASSM